LDFAEVAKSKSDVDIGLEKAFQDGVSDEESANLGPVPVLEYNSTFFES
jgi:hypothetical protein